MERREERGREEEREMWEREGRRGSRERWGEELEIETGRYRERGREGGREGVRKERKFIFTPFVTKIIFLS